jgi:hypothetical protein
MFNFDPVLKTFYAYLWLREDGTPYYAGKGCGNRAYERHKGHWAPRDRSRILVLDRTSEQAAFETEIELIRNWGRKDLGTGCLRNRTNGGEGASGKGPHAMMVALENLKKATAAVKGKPKTEEHRRRNSESLKKHVRTPEHGQNISKAKKGKANPKIVGALNPQWGKLPTNAETLKILNASRPRDARGRFFHV